MNRGIVFSRLSSLNEIQDSDDGILCAFLEGFFFVNFSFLAGANCARVFREVTGWAKTLTFIGVWETLKSVGELKVFYHMAYWRQRLWFPFLCSPVALSGGSFGMLRNKQSGWFWNHWCLSRLAGCHQKIFVINERDEVVLGPAPALLSWGVVWNSVCPQNFHCCCIP